MTQALSTLSNTNRNLRVRYSRYGAPAEVLELEEAVLKPLKPGRVRIRMRYAPIHPSDFGRILGSYGNLAELPHVGGREGVGEVVEIGKGVQTMALGVRVLLPQSQGTWQQFADYSPEELYSLPQDFPLEAAALFQVNPPTAWRLLEYYSQSKMAGTPIIQNAGNSSVGILLGQMARSRGIRVIHLARSEEARMHLRALGFEHVIADDEAGYQEIAEMERPGFALNSVGGESVMRLIKAVRNGGEVVTIGGMSREKVRFPTRELIFKQIHLTGFWLDQWGNENPREKDRIWQEVMAWIEKEKPQFPVAGRFSLDRYKEAIEEASKSRWGKVLFTGECS